MRVIPYIPERVTLARELAGLTRVELAAKFEVTPHMLTDLIPTPSAQEAAR